MNTNMDVKDFLGEYKEKPFADKYYSGKYKENPTDLDRIFEAKWRKTGVYTYFGMNREQMVQMQKKDFFFHKIKTMRNKSNRTKKSYT